MHVNDEKPVQVSLVTPSVRMVVLHLWKQGDRIETSVSPVLCLKSILYNTGFVRITSVISHDDNSFADHDAEEAWQQSNPSVTVTCTWPESEDEEKFKPYFESLKKELPEKEAQYKQTMAVRRERSKQSGTRATTISA